MKQVLFDDMYSWSVFSEARQIDFNGHLWVRPQGNVLIDPVAMTAADMEQFDALGGAAWIVVTNRDHERQAAFFKARTGAKIVAHSQDVALLETAADKAVEDGDQIVPGLQVIHLPKGKSPGEIALYWPDRRLVLSGDLVVGAPIGRFSLLMDEKLADPAGAALELRRLLRLDFDSMLVGDGHSILQNARQLLIECLQARGDGSVPVKGASVIVVHPSFDGVWPYAADHFHALWRQQGNVEFIRLAHGDERLLGEVVPQPAAVRRLVNLGVASSLDCMQRFSGLTEATFQGAYGRKLDEASKELLEARKIKVYDHPSEGFWSQTVAEYGLALTLCGLRRIPQLHRQIINDLSPWDYEPAEGKGQPGARGQQFGDDPAFSSGTVAGKRVRIVGAGNIASRYASFVHMLGADVAAWDPFATEPSFHRAGSRREWHLDRLVQDAEIFAPMVPLRESTQGLVTADHINALPKGCLVVLVTRAMICDMEALRRRVLNDELSLAADVWDREPLPLDDAFLGRHNVVHTPHNAGRTIDANKTWSEKLAEQFLPA